MLFWPQKFGDLKEFEALRCAQKDAENSHSNGKRRAYPKLRSALSNLIEIGICMTLVNIHQNTFRRAILFVNIQNEFFTAHR